MIKEKYVIPVKIYMSDVKFSKKLMQNVTRFRATMNIVLSKQLLTLIISSNTTSITISCISRFCFVFVLIFVIHSFSMYEIPVKINIYPI